METNDRLHALDALRAMAMLSVVVFHACVSYMTLRIPDLLWAIYDPRPDAFFDRLFLWIHGFAMPVFFLIAGFFAAKLYKTLGPRRFLENRSRRILRPFLLGVMAILPFIYIVWSYGWFLSGESDARSVLLFKIARPIRRNLYGPAHLWFLEYLMIHILIFYFAGRYQKISGPRCAKRILFSPLRPVFFALPTALILLIHPGALFALRNSFIPEPFRLLHYAWFFIAGVWLYPFRENLADLVPKSGFYLLLSLPVFCWVEPLIKRHLAAPLYGVELFWLAVSTALFVWLSVFGLLGISLRFFKNERPVVRCLSDASYWIYLCHLPVVGFFQIILYLWPHSAFIKFPVVVLSALAFGLTTHRLLYRTTSHRERSSL